MTDSAREDPHVVRDRIERQLEYLAEQLARLEAKLPSEAELVKWREMAIADERASWARKQVAVWAPILVAVVVGVWQTIDWLRTHITLR